MTEEQIKLKEMLDENDLERFGKLLNQVHESSNSEKALVIVGHFLLNADPHLLRRNSLIALKTSINVVLDETEGGR